MFIKLQLLFKTKLYAAMCLRKLESLTGLFHENTQNENAEHTLPYFCIGTQP